MQTGEDEMPMIQNQESSIWHIIEFRKRDTGRWCTPLCGSFTEERSNAKILPLNQFHRICQNCIKSLRKLEYTFE